MSKFLKARSIGLSTLSLQWCLDTLFICDKYQTCPLIFNCYHKKISAFIPDIDSDYWCDDINIRNITEDELCNIKEIGENLDLME